jgi:hypothetical protein
MDLADIYRIFHTTAAQYAFFSAVHGTFSKIDHILRHQESLSKYKKIEISHAFYLTTIQRNYKSTTKTAPTNMQTIGS